MTTITTASKISIEDIKRKHENKGLYFFNKSTIKYWKSIIYKEVYNNKYFITSEEDFTGTRRLFSIREFVTDDATIKTVGIFQGYASKKEAVEALKDLIKGN